MSAVVALLSARLASAPDASGPRRVLAGAAAGAGAAVDRFSSPSCFCRRTGGYEPREFVEGFDVSLTTLAVAGDGRHRLCASCAACDGVAARGATDRPTGCARPGRWRSPASRMPAFAIDADAPVMALVGVLRPRLLITRPVLDALTDEELQRRASRTSSGTGARSTT